MFALSAKTACTVHVQCIYNVNELQDYDIYVWCNVKSLLATVLAKG